MNTARRRGAFISYSRKDKDFALEFAGELKSAGYSVWLDQLDIPTGARWDDEVERALHECEVFLIILTPASASSENVKDEIGYAIDHGKRIMPVLLEECDIPLRLRRFQYVDFTKTEFSEGIRGTQRLLETLLNEQSTSATIISRGKTQKDPAQEVRPTRPLPNKNKTQSQWIGVGIGIGILALICLGALVGIVVFRNAIFPLSPTNPPINVTLTDLPTAPLTDLPVTEIPMEPPVVPPTEPPVGSSLVLWTIDSTGVCRDSTGGYPRWSEYNWTLSQCEDACRNNPNCQGFAMSKEKNYCQIFGSDGQYDGSSPSIRITQGDQSHPNYACYLKSNGQDVSAWMIDSTGVCRDSGGGYPRWSAYDWTLSQCEDACRNNPDCQGFAMAKEKNKCQLFGADGQYDGSGSSTQITQGDSSHPAWICFLKR
ncbi:hypothetical protein ANAEL_02683 [Anaerolineales bacterium]|nr:hypothetical protein ANAEL_02683 [Anaerolineales bacterium]